MEKIYSDVQVCKIKCFIVFNNFSHMFAVNGLWLASALTFHQQQHKWRNTKPSNHPWQYKEIGNFHFPHWLLWRHAWIEADFKIHLVVFPALWIWSSKDGGDVGGDDKDQEAESHFSDASHNSLNHVRRCVSFVSWPKASSGLEKTLLLTLLFTCPM